MAGLALVLALVMGVLAIPQISALEDSGDSLANGIGAFFDTMTFITLLIVVGVICVGTLAAGFLYVMRHV